MSGTSGARVLVLGGTGFIGGHVVRALLARGHDPLVLARGGRPAPGGAELRTADRADEQSMSEALEGERFDFTIDLSAYDAGDVERLLLVPHAALGRYVMMSTGQVYLVTTDDRMPYREEQSDAPLRPEPAEGSNDHANWVYGVGKRRAEGALMALRASHGVRGTILRIPVVIGEEDSSRRLWGYVERMLDGGPIVLPDGGRRQVRYVYAGDVARVLVQMVEGLVPREAVYNLAQPESLPLREFLAKAAALAGCRTVFEEAPWEEVLAAGIDRWYSPYGSRWLSVLDPARAAAEWGFLGTRVDDYLPGVVNWHLQRRPQSHPGYAERAKELAFAAAMAARRAGAKPG